MGDLGTYIREQRDRKGLTQRQLAEKAGLTFQAISMIELGHRRQIGLDTAFSLADALDVDVTEIRKRMKKDSQRNPALATA